MGLSDFERRLERGVEGVFGRVFRSGVRPVELGRKLVREMDVHRTVAVSGATMAPNAFTLVLAGADFEQLADMEEALADELVALAKAHALDEHYRFAGPVEVYFEVDDQQRPGVVTIDARFRQPAPGQAIAALVLPTGVRVPLSDAVVTIGRQSDSDIVLGDANASRRHAEVRPALGGFVVVDLASTNGTKVNGRLVGEQALNHGDEIQFGATVIRFEKD
ncbi:MAG: DUF3662 and FHA domain-containing protein [Acidimicrobiales bacterium]